MIRKITFAEEISFDVDFEDSAFNMIMSELNGGGIVGVACSGGADSVFLLYCLADIFKDKKENLRVLHFNHKIREAADADEAFVRDVSYKLGIKCFCANLENPKKISEETLRNARIDFYLNVSQDLTCITQGHHADDVAETLIMRLMRGSGGDGLCAPRPVSKYNNMNFVRPLLRLRKSDIKNCLSAAKIEWREDESNAQTDFFRNKIRNIIIPEIKKISSADFVSSAIRTRALLEEDSAALEDVFTSEIESANSENRDEKKIFLTKNILNQTAFIRRAVMLLLSKNDISIHSVAAESIIKNIISQKDFRASAGKMFFRFSKKEMSICIDDSKKIEEFCIDLRVGKNVLPGGDIIGIKKVSLTKTQLAAIKNGENDDSLSAYLDLSSVGNVEAGCAVARSRKAGDAYAPIGAKSPKKIKDLLVAKKVPSMKRNAIPLVCNKKGEILWIPSLPPANQYKLAESLSAFELTFEPFES